MEFNRIIIKGIVQGIGFRPFLYNLAKKIGLNGVIINKGNVGVEIITSNLELVDSFIAKIRSDKPKISYIEEIQVDLIETNSIDVKIEKIDDIVNKLQILPSEKGIGAGLTLPPDIAMCDECVNEMNNLSKKRFFKYPFIACAQCGPRFTTVMELPYDRERTTMKEFPYCHIYPLEKGFGSCTQEYSDFKDRRFHAQTFACNKCGPNYFFQINDKFVNVNDFKETMPNLEYSKYSFKTFKKNINSKNTLKSNEEISNDAWVSVKIAAKMIENGYIIAVMGIGGVHLIGLADNDKVIERLRERKKERKFKPFAIMVNNIESAKKIAHISKEEEDILTSFRRPIILLEKKSSYDLPKGIAPGLNNIGLMLPYTGIHYLLFNLLDNNPLIYTSGNISGFPMAITPKDVIIQLNRLADGFLLHNRLIYQRCDDSVVRYHSFGEKLIRRSRGYVPEYIPLPFNTDISAIISLGPELNSTGCIGRGHRLFPTQHVGVNSIETLQFLEDSIIHMKNLLKIKDNEIQIIAHDAHPLFYSNRLIDKFKKKFNVLNNNVNIFSIQHHFAHAASLMVDNGIEEDETAVIVTLDGVGYGLDGNVWGGEIIYGTYRNLKRGPHLSYIPMIGSDQCVKYPSRMLFGFLIKAYGISEAINVFTRIGASTYLKYGESELNGMKYSYQNNQNVALTSSCGRLLDAISSLLGVCQEKTYRGEPAMRLEGFTANGDIMKYDFHTIVLDDLKKARDNNVAIIRSELIITKTIELLTENSKKHLTNEAYNKFLMDIGASILNSIGVIFSEISFEYAKKHGINAIGLSGGVSYNKILSESFFEHLKYLIEKDTTHKNIKILFHHNIPPGDAGISIGQAAIAIAKYNNL